MRKRRGKSKAGIVFAVAGVGLVAAVAVLALKRGSGYVPKGPRTAFTPSTFSSTTTSLTWWGSGFTPNATSTITFTIGTITGGPDPGPTMDASGGFSITYTSSPGPVGFTGTITFVVTDATGKTASTILTIVL